MESHTGKSESMPPTPDNFAISLKSPAKIKEAIAWAKAEIKEYENLIEILEKKINTRRK